jgi:hypothetical protein
LTVLAPEHVLSVWGLKTSVIDSTQKAVSILSLAQLLQATTIIPYYVCLCYGNVLPSIITSILFLGSLLLQYTLLSSASTIENISQAFLWSSIATIPFYMLAVHWLHIRSQFKYWLSHGVIVPGTLSFGITYIFMQIASLTNQNSNRLSESFTLFITGASCMIAIIFANIHLRNLLTKRRLHLHTSDENV